MEFTPFLPNINDIIKRGKIRLLQANLSFIIPMYFVFSPLSYQRIQVAFSGMLPEKVRYAS